MNRWFASGKEGRFSTPPFLRPMMRKHIGKNAIFAFLFSLIKFKIILT
jgi:hypothetical protein